MFIEIPVIMKRTNRIFYVFQFDKFIETFVDFFRYIHFIHMVIISAL